MPVKFVCSQCRQVLSVTRRKIGYEVPCPRCNATCLVPDEATGAAAVDQLHAAHGAALTEVDVYEVIDHLLPPPGAASPDTSMLGGPAPIAPPASMPAPQLAPRGQGPGVSDMLLVSRRVVYLQAGLFCVVAAAAFAGGFFLGRGRPLEPQVLSVGGHKEQPVSLAGEVSYTAADGSVRRDAGAMVIALPVDKQPSRLFEARGLRPQDASDSLAEAAELAVHELGGDAVRLDATGTFHLVVSAAGDYHVLILSAGAKRSSAQLDPAVVGELARYFASPTELVGLSEFSWTTLHLGPNPPPLVHGFGAK